LETFVFLVLLAAAAVWLFGGNKMRGSDDHRRGNRRHRGRRCKCRW
jgi:hypothetical protein